MHDVSIPRGELNRIIRDRLVDILVRVGKRVPEEVWKKPGLSVYFSGGTSLMRGLDSLAHHIYGVPVHQPIPVAEGQQYSYLADPRYCTAIGLIRFAQRFDDEALHNPSPGIFNWIMRLFGRR